MKKYVLVLGLFCFIYAGHSANAYAQDTNIRQRMYSKVHRIMKNRIKQGNNSYIGDTNTNKSYKDKYDGISVNYDDNYSSAKVTYQVYQ